jgi:hypothetical protein
MNGFESRGALEGYRISRHMSCFFKEIPQALNGILRLPKLRPRHLQFLGREFVKFQPGIFIHGGTKNGQHKLCGERYPTKTLGDFYSAYLDGDSNFRAR